MVLRENIINETITATKENIVNNYNIYYELLIYVGFPILFLIGFYYFIKNKEKLKAFYYDFFKKTYIRVYFLNNQNFKPTFKELDKFNNFSIGEKTYNLDNLDKFIIGYENKIPVFFYDSNFILPFILNQTKLTDELKKVLEKDGIPVTQKTINSLIFKINPTLLKLVYDKKLLHDLYSSVDNSSLLDNPIIKYTLIGIALYVAYETGLLDKIGAFIGM